MKTSEKYSVDLRDIISVFSLIVGAAAIDYIIQCINKGMWPIDWSELLKVSLIPGLYYLGKKFRRPAKRITDP